MKVRCVEYDCSWYGHDESLLVVPHPFIAGETLFGCPRCKNIGYDLVCDEPFCLEIVVAGTPTANGYRQTCSKHKPKL